MDISSILKLATVAMFASGLAHAGELPEPGISYDECVSNCVSTVRYDDSLMIFARNRDGEIFKTLSIELPARARRMTDGAPRGDLGWDLSAGDPGARMLSDVPVGSVCGGYPGVCTETAMVRYETTTHVVIYTFTFVFSNGDLVEVRVDETRVAKSKLQ